MSTEGDDLAADLKALADTLLARLGPVVRQAAATNSTSPGSSSGGSSSGGPKPEWQGCSWCPVCAIAAVLRGEQHDLVTLLSVEGASLVAIVRDFLAAHGADVGSGGHGAPGPSPARPRAAESGSSWPVETETGESTDGDAAAPGSIDADGASIDAGASRLDQDPSMGLGTQPTSRSQFIPITVTTKQSPTEDRSRP